MYTGSHYSTPSGKHRISTHEQYVSPNTNPARNLHQMAMLNNLTMQTIGEYNSNISPEIQQLYGVNNNMAYNREILNNYGAASPNEQHFANQYYLQQLPLSNDMQDSNNVLDNTLAAEIARTKALTVNHAKYPQAPSREELLAHAAVLTKNNPSVQVVEIPIYVDNPVIHYDPGLGLNRSQNMNSNQNQLQIRAKSRENISPQKINQAPKRPINQNCVAKNKNTPSYGGAFRGRVQNSTSEPNHIAKFLNNKPKSGQERTPQIKNETENIPEEGMSLHEMVYLSVKKILNEQASVINNSYNPNQIGAIPQVSNSKPSEDYCKTRTYTELQKKRNESSSREEKRNISKKNRNYRRESRSYSSSNSSTSNDRDSSRSCCKISVIHSRRNKSKKSNSSKTRRPRKPPLPIVPLKTPDKTIKQRLPISTKKSNTREDLNKNLKHDKNLIENISRKTANIRLVKNKSKSDSLNSCDCYGSSTRRQSIESNISEQSFCSERSEPNLLDFPETALMAPPKGLLISTITQNKNDYQSRYNKSKINQFARERELSPELLNAFQKEISLVLVEKNQQEAEIDDCATIGTDIDTVTKTQFRTVEQQNRDIVKKLSAYNMQGARIRYKKED